VKCRVDRIDHMGAGDCVIVDYKSGKSTNVEKLVESSARLQGPLYALAVREKLGLRTIAMMYIAVREDKRFGWGAVPGVDLDLKEMPPDWIEAARARSVERWRVSSAAREGRTAGARHLPLVRLRAVVPRGAARAGQDRACPWRLSSPPSSWKRFATWRRMPAWWPARLRQDHRAGRALQPADR